MGSPVLTAVAWPYANGPRHIGHVSGFGVPADVFARYQRMAGADVLMVSGTDEHGTPILVQADAEGIPARDLADRYNRVIVEDLADLPVDRADLARPLHRGHLPDLRLRRCARRPVRQLRQPARPDRPEPP